MKSEFGGEIEAERRVAFLGEFHLLPLKRADVGIGCGAFLREIAQVEIKIVARKREGNAVIVVNGGAIAQFEMADAQAEQSVAPGASRAGAALWRDVAVAIMIDLDEHFGAIEHELAQRDLMAEKRNDAK